MTTLPGSFKKRSPHHFRSGCPFSSPEDDHSPPAGLFHSGSGLFLYQRVPHGKRFKNQVKEGCDQNPVSPASQTMHLLQPSTSWRKLRLKRACKRSGRRPSPTVRNLRTKSITASQRELSIGEGLLYGLEVTGGVQR